MISSTSIPGPAYRITTSRLVIRCPQPEDAAALDLAVTESLDHLQQWVHWARYEPVSLQERIEFLRKTRGEFDLGESFGYLILNLAETLVLGGAGLHTRLGKDAREIGYWIHKDHINQGYATEVSAALTRVAFEIDHVSRVEIHCSPDNLRSAAVPRKLGFTHEATLHHRGVDEQGKPRDSMIWTLFDENYPTSPAARAEIQAFDAIGRRII